MLQIDWNRLRLTLGANISETQAEGFNAILKALNDEGASLKQACFLLSVVLSETNRKMLPKEEDEYSDFYIQMYDIEGLRPTVAMRMGNTVAGDGEKYKQRGFLPVLGKTNYKTIGATIGVDLVQNPEKLMELDIASKALVKGVFEGTYTGYPLSKFINTRSTDYTNACRASKGLENAKKISFMAQQLEKVLKEV